MVLLVVFGLFWDSSLWKANILSTTTQLMRMEISPHGGSPSLLTACYVCPQPSLRSVLWNDLHSIATLVHNHWCVIGDFNAVVYDHELSGSASSHKGCQHFCDCVLDCNFFLMLVFVGLVILGEDLL